ncbi:MAG TPA: hypothetical protein VMY05_01985 [Acidobacteriota bacterium]|nr:hypothetical protein [Acidobacteriota bacterium]
MDDAEQVKVVVDGKELEINQFVSTVVGNVVSGVILSLKLDHEPQTIEVTVVRK